MNSFDLIIVHHTKELISTRKTSHRHNITDVPLMEFMYFAFTRMPCESYTTNATQVFVVVSQFMWRLSNAD